MPGFVITQQNAEIYEDETEKRWRVDERASLGCVAEHEGIGSGVIYLGSDRSILHIW